MKIEQLKTIDLIPYVRNAKEHTDKQVELIANSIRKFGWTQPIVIDKQNEIVIGHGRLLAAKLLNLPEVPCLRVENLTEAEIKALRLADNRLNEITGFDMKLVKLELKDLPPEVFDYTGFDKDLIIEPDAKDDEVPTDAPSVAQVGDMWQLGRHRIMCGDSTLPGDVEKLMGGFQADMVFTDPPYNVNYAGRGENTSQHIENDNMDRAKFQEFLNAVFMRIATHTKRGGGMYVFHASSTQREFENALEMNGITIKNQLIWNKPTASMGWGDYRWKHEPFFYAAFKDAETRFYGDRTNYTVIDFQKDEPEILKLIQRIKKSESQGKTTIWTMKRDNVQEYVHPTQKPVELITFALANSSKEGDIVLDLFGGSGSTIIAAEKAHRACYSMELDPKFVDIIIARWQEYTGQQAVKI